MSPPLPTPNDTSTTSTPTVKLRDSCHACASSKLRCTKEKPTCSRCAKRGKSCQYFVTRRAGRKQASKSGIETAAPPPESSSTAWKSGSSKSHVPAASQPPVAAVMAGSIHVLQDQYNDNNTNNINYADSNSDLLASTSSPTSAVPTRGDLAMEFDELFPSSLDPSMGDGSDISNCVDFYFGQNCIIDPTMTWTHALDKTGLKLGHDLRLLDASSISSTQSHTPSYALPSQPQPEQHQPPLQRAREGQQQQQQQNQQQPASSGSPLSNQSCACVAKTLGLVSQLFQEPVTSPPTSPMCLSSGGSSESSQHERLAADGPVNASFADGERAIETIRSMLQCPCQQDSYLLALMSLVIFKALARYEDAARRSTENAATTLAQTSSYGAASTTSGRTGLVIGEENPHPKLAVQTLLGKLHRVQGLVNAMSQRLRMSNSSNNNSNSNNSKTGDVHTRTRAETSFAGERRDTLGCSNTDASVPFSTTFLSQLEEDLRMQVRSVSFLLVDTLREL